MDKKVLAALVVIIILVVGFFVLKSNKNIAKMPGTVQKNPVTQQASQETLTGKIQDLILAGKSIKCHYEKDSQNSADVFINGKDFYGEFTNQGKISHMVFKDSCSWIWSDGQAQGVKVCNALTPSSSPADAFKNAGNIPNVNYSCQPASGFSDKFVLPTTVQFMDVSSFMKK